MTCKTSKTQAPRTWDQNQSSKLVQDRTWSPSALTCLASGCVVVDAESEGNEILADNEVGYHPKFGDEPLGECIGTYAHLSIYNEHLLGGICSTTEKQAHQHTHKRLQATTATTASPREKQAHWKIEKDEKAPPWGQFLPRSATLVSIYRLEDELWHVNKINSFGRGSHRDYRTRAGGFSRCRRYGGAAGEWVLYGFLTFGYFLQTADLAGANEPWIAKAFLGTAESWIHGFGPYHPLPSFATPAIGTRTAQVCVCEREREPRLGER